MDEGMLVLDTRSPEAIAGAFIQGSLAIPLDMIPAFAGWFISHDSNIGLVVNSYEDVELGARYLLRLGYDRIIGFLEDGLTAWEISGRQYKRIPAVHAEELVKRLQDDVEFTLLDVRKKEEFESGHLPGAVHIYVGELSENLDKIPTARPITTFCGSGKRAIIAASVLKKHGFDRVEDSLGSMAACSAIGCPILTEEGK